MSDESDLETLGVLVEPQRMRVYEHLLAAASPSSLADIGGSLGMSRTLLAFHLAKLVESGFVEVLAPEASGRRGRPSQLYRATRQEVAASVPTRNYALIAEVLLEASGDSGPIADAARRVAHRRGVELGAAERVRRAPRTTSGQLAPVLRLLSRLGYAPRREGDRVVMASCPFDRLRDTNLGLVCAINHALAGGYLEGLELPDLSAELEPCPDMCCVVVSPA